MRVASSANFGLARPSRESLSSSLRLSYVFIEVLAIGLDCSVIILASVLGQVLFGYMWQPRSFDVLVVSGIGTLICLVHVAIAHNLGYYRVAVLASPNRHLRRIVSTAIVVGLALTAILALLKTGSNFSRGAVVVFLLVESVLLVVARSVQGVILRRFLARGAIVGKPVFLIGDAQELGRLSATALLFHFGQREAGRMVLPHHQASEADVKHAVMLARQCGAKAFSLAVEWADTSCVGKLDQALRDSPLAVQLLPDFRARTILSRHSRDSMARSMMVVLQRSPLTYVEQLAKRAFDLLMASVALLLLSPIMLAVALAIKLDSPGPAIFRQQRKGFDQRPFTIYKFRSMTVQEDGAAVTQAKRNDNRVTKLGRLLRRTSIDELPQLLNVLQGSMSLVGPRPHAVAHDDHYGERIAIYCRRHHVKPGITGWAQVKGVRGETVRIQDMQARVDLDVWYVNNWSLVLDFIILARTCVSVLGHKAY